MKEAADGRNRTMTFTIGSLYKLKLDPIEDGRKSVDVDSTFYTIVFRVRGLLMNNGLGHWDKRYEPPHIELRSKNENVEMMRARFDKLNGTMVPYTIGISDKRGGYTNIQIPTGVVLGKSTHITVAHYSAGLTDEEMATVVKMINEEYHN